MGYWVSKEKQRYYVWYQLCFDQILSCCVHTHMNLIATT